VGYALEIVFQQQGTFVHEKPLKEFSDYYPKIYLFSG
jgi:hypothetical protein